MDVELYKAAKEGKEEFFQKKPQIRDEEVRGGGGSGSGTHGKNLQCRTHQENNIVHIAARHGLEKFIEKALGKYPNLFNQKNSKGDTPLHVAARFGHLEVVELLVKHYNSPPPQLEENRVTKTNHANSTPGRDIEEGLAKDLVHPLWQEENSEGDTALHDALRNGNEKVSLFLLRLDPNMACSEKLESLLYLAAESGCEKVMAEILDSNLQYSVQGPGGQNPLHAAKYCSANSISHLLRRKKDLATTPDHCGKTAFNYAIEANDRQLMTLLLGTDTSIAYLPDKEGLTPLLRASSMGHLWPCQHIIKFCPESIEARNGNGQNAVHLFQVRLHSDFQNFLKIPEIKELINDRDDDGNTPLHLAIANKDYTKASLLLFTDVDVRAINKAGLTALDACESDWNHSYQQIRIRYYLQKRKAPRGRHPKQIRNEMLEPNWKKMATTLSLIAALLATVTFTAAFTMPGGYNSNGNDLGVAVLIKKTALQIFVLSDTFALCCSIIVVFFLLWALVSEPELLRSLTIISQKLIKVALCGTLVAFVSGLYAVTAPLAFWVAILVSTMCSIVPIAVSRDAIMGSAIAFWLKFSLIGSLLNKLLIKGKIYLRRLSQRHYGCP